TKGLLLERHAEPLRAAGRDRVNVSLPSMDPTTYQRVTGVDGAARAVRGIRAAARAGLAPIKLNVVAIHGATDSRDAAEELLRFAQEVGAWLQIIEFEPVRGRVDPRVYRALHSELGRLTEEAAAQALRVDRNRLHDRPRYTYLTGGGTATVEVVQPVENPDFCMACHRLRLTSNGLLKGCLMTNEGLLDLRPILAAGSDDAPLRAAFATAIGRRRPFYVGPQTPVPVPSTELPVLAGEPLPVLAP
ncbi:MAG: radical SAM protein, partial [Thermoplasmata archaeon]